MHYKTIFSSEPQIYQFKVSELVLLIVFFYFLDQLVQILIIIAETDWSFEIELRFPS